MPGLNRSALSVLTSSELSAVTGGLPGPIRTVVETESRMRSMFSGTGSSYADFERLAVLGGAVPRGEGSVDTPASRWSQHPDGYWVRYKPNGYSNTLVQIWVPQGSAAVGKSYEPWLAIAVPGNTSRQRLAQSARVYSPLKSSHLQHRRLDSVSPCGSHGGEGVRPDATRCLRAMMRCWMTEGGVRRPMPAIATGTTRRIRPAAAQGAGGRGVLSQDRDHLQRLWR